MVAGQEARPAHSTWDGYRRKINRHILPTLGKVPIRRLRPHHLETLYNHKLHPTDGPRALAPKTVLEIHLIIRGALNDAVERGIVSRHVALVAHAPKLRAIPKVEQQAWTAQQLQAFLHAAAGHRLFPAFWLAANTGMRRSELLGLKWDDIDCDTAPISINRDPVSVGYELHETRGKTSTSRRAIDLDPATVGVGVRQRLRRTDPPAFDLPDLRVDRAAGQCPQDPAPRPAAHSRHAAQSRRPRQSRLRTTRPQQPGVHHRHLPARPPRHASPSSTHLRATDRPGPFYREQPVEPTVEQCRQDGRSPGQTTV
ncbi:MAG TPA: hypothetical protein ENH00_13930 [Actinobacteria bacterium]|nr:hypothetical protein [Actinomycetota bacterium]